MSHFVIARIQIERLTLTPNQRFSLRRLALSERGASRSSRTLGAGCGGRFGDARRAALMRTAKPCGPDAPTLASSFAGSDSCEAMVARKPGHQGERGISRKPLRREGRIVSANLWRLRSCAFFLHARLWVRRAPGFPCALHFLRVILNDNSGAIRAARTWAHIPP